VVQRAPGQVLSRSGHLAAVLGSPVVHSLSPALHNAAYRALRLDSWRYCAHEVRESALVDFVSGLGPEWAGLSLTMPLKEVAFRVADEVSPLAREVGAVNTLVRLPGDGWAAHNTDVHGVEQALAGVGLTTIDEAVVLGSGATARSVLAALARLGARRVTFAVRDLARPETLAHAERAGVQAVVRPLSEVARLAAATPLVVSTLPGRAGEQVSADLAAAVPPGSWPGTAAGSGPVLFDVVYAGWPTPLARTFSDRGSVVVSGFEMLLHQAGAQVELMTGLEPPLEVMRAAGLAELARR